MDDRAEAIDILTRMSTNHFYGHREQEAFKLAAEALSAERRGRWILRYGDGHIEMSIVGGECSLCGSVGPATRYCPNCGAKMEGEQNE